MPLHLVTGQFRVQVPCQQFGLSCACAEHTVLYILKNVAFAEDYRGQMRAESIGRRGSEPRQTTRLLWQEYKSRCLMEALAPFCSPFAGGTSPEASRYHQLGPNGPDNRGPSGNSCSSQLVQSKWLLRSMRFCVEGDTLRNLFTIRLEDHTTYTWPPSPKLVKSTAVKFACFRAVFE